MLLCFAYVLILAWIKKLSQSNKNQYDYGFKTKKI